jgi:hypothetical protein
MVHRAEVEREKSRAKAGEIEVAESWRLKPLLAHSVKNVGGAEFRGVPVELKDAR